MKHDRSVRAVMTGEEELRRRARAFVRERPLLCVAGAAVLGATLGGVFFAKLGRLAFVALAGYVANEIWHREGRLDVGTLVDRLSPNRGAPSRSTVSQ
jgi:hypothetical protein